MNQTITIPEGYELQKVNDYEYKIVKKEAELPNSWDEFCENYPVKPEESCTSSTSGILVIHKNFERDRNKYNDKNLLPNKEYAEAILTLCQLIQLRDCYRQGWKPDWKDTNTFHVSIMFKRDEVQLSDFNITNQLFAFQSIEIRNKFYCNFKDLIEKIKPLFM